MDTEANFQHLNTEQLIDGMMSFLDGMRHVILNPSLHSMNIRLSLCPVDSTEDSQLEEFDELKNPLCWAIKRIINIFPVPVGSKNFNPSEGQDTLRDPLGTFYGNRMHANQIEKVCRYKDPYMLEVNRLMFCSSVGHPPNGSPEYYQAAENYALFGKEFLDFPTDMKFPQPLDVGCFGEVSSIPTSLSKLQPPPGFGMQIGKCTKQLTSTSAPQQQILVNQTNYCSYPFFHAQNLVQPLIYSNPFLMTQYLNTFVKETQINTSLVQQQQFLAGGIHERLVYAQMLQQQIQTNQAALMSSCFVGSGGAGAGASTKCKHEMVKMGPNHGSDWSSASLKSDLDGGGVDENPTIEQ